jgi:hypothetical protein
MAFYKLFPGKKDMESIIWAIIVCLQYDFDQQGFISFPISKKPSLPYIISIQVLFFLAQGVSCQPEAKLIGALGGLFYLLSTRADVVVKIGVGVFFNQRGQFKFYA